jgi:leucyl aminopeptidase
MNGAIDAGVFLESFTHGHPAWAHLDIAGVAFGNSVFSKDKSATGYGVHLLYTFIKRIIETDLNMN